MGLSLSEPTFGKVPYLITKKCDEPKTLEVTSTCRGVQSEGVLCPRFLLGSFFLMMIAEGQRVPLGAGPLRGRGGRTTRRPDVDRRSVAPRQGGDLGRRHHRPHEPPRRSPAQVN